MDGFLGEEIFTNYCYNKTMNNPSTLFQQRLTALNAPAADSILQGIKRGVEKESLRITPDGYLATTPHPYALGSNLTHPNITTDYSEALIELITPPVDNAEEVIDWLLDLHTYTYQHLDQELLWVTSMPCTLTREADIPIAEYGRSNLGQMKYIYRRGLDHRYGKAMQVIAGIHVNFSFPENFWIYYQQLLDDKQPLQDFINQQYFGMIRNFLRYSWLMIALFGASPTLCKSFLRQSSSELQVLNGGTPYAPEGTSLRMSDLGYQNNRQHQFTVSRNSLEEYVHDLGHACATIEPDYIKYGSVAEGKLDQLNANILQIEAEYYSPIRPKRIAKERPLSALSKYGVEYIEVRVVDLDPYEPVGINAHQIRFVESFLLMCLLQPSAPLTCEEQTENKDNLRAAVYHGRNMDTLLHEKGQPKRFQDWGLELSNQIQLCAEVLDKHYDSHLYQQAVTSMQEKLLHPELLSSNRMIRDMSEYHDKAFLKFAHHWSQEHRDFFLNRYLSTKRRTELEQLAKESHEKQKQIEAADTMSLAEYVKRYLES